MVKKVSKVLTATVLGFSILFTSGGFAEAGPTKPEILKNQGEVTPQGPTKPDIL